jgi:hypothetical protein
MFMHILQPKILVSQRNSAETTFTNWQTLINFFSALQRQTPNTNVNKAVETNYSDLYLQLTFYSSCMLSSLHLHKAEVIDQTPYTE